MTTVRYTLTPLTRVSAAQGGQLVNNKAVHTVIPGTAVRGALGRAWLHDPDRAAERGGLDTDALYEQFHRGVRVHQAVPHPVVETEANVADPVGGGFVSLQWQSLATCKYPESGCDPTWHDEALRGPRPTCSSCGGSVEHGQGWNTSVRLVSSTRSALTKDGVPESGRLFTRRALPATDAVLRGHVEASDPALLAWLRETKEMRLGGSRSTLGLCRWEADTWEPEPPTATARTVVVTASPAILLDSYGGPSLDLAAELARHRPDGGTVDPRPWVRPVAVTAWNGVAGVPRPTDLAVAAGSVAVLVGWDPQSLAALAGGIGVRRDEGFGQLWFLDADGRVQPTVPLTGSPLPRPPRPVSPPPPPAGEPSGDTSSAEEAPAPEPPPDPCRRLAAQLEVDPDARQRVLRALLTAGRQLLRTAENGFPESYVRTVATQHLARPWATDLGPDARELVREVLQQHSDDARQTGSRADHVRHLEALLGGTDG